MSQKKIIILYLLFFTVTCFGENKFDIEADFLLTASEELEDNDFSLLNELISNTMLLTEQEWNEWARDHIDRDEIVKYMIVHDFLGVIDTHYQNFYIYFHESALLLPWDNELGIDINHLPSIGGNNILTQRLLEEPYMRSLYNERMREYFLQVGEQNIIQDLIDELGAICREIDRAVYYDPTFYITYDTFLLTAAELENFLIARPATIQNPPLS